jgi:hypothetical protein
MAQEPFVQFRIIVSFRPGIMPGIRINRQLNIGFEAVLKEIYQSLTFFWFDNPILTPMKNPDWQGLKGFS